MTDPISLDATDLPSLLGPGDPPPCEVINPRRQASVVLLCDHASNAIPRSLDNLGLGRRALGKHIAWDLGAAAVTRRLAERFQAPAVLTGYSRLVIDCNRQPGDPSSIPEVSDGIIVPGNAQLDDTQADQRLEEVFWPYHHTITKIVSHVWRHGPAPALVNLHSFTPVMNGVQRPWHLGVLWNHDQRMARPLLRLLRSHADTCVGDNEPYSARGSMGFTINNHAGAAGLPHVELEMRQDLIADEAGCERWAATIGDALAEVLADSHVHSVEYF